MAAVDAPPGLSFAGTAAGEFVARRAAQRLARFAFGYVSVLSMLILALARRHIHSQQGIEVLLAAPILFIGIALLGYMVRRATLRVTSDGVRWGWQSYGFFMKLSRLRKVVVYDDSVAVVPKRGTSWYVSSRDWAQFNDIMNALRAANIVYERVTGSAPLRARLQSFGLALDVILLANALGATLVLGIAFAL